VDWELLWIICSHEGGVHPSPVVFVYSLFFFSFDLSRPSSFCSNTGVCARELGQRRRRTSAIGDSGQPRPRPPLLGERPAKLGRLGSTGVAGRGGR
jgi:hypothetical protein